MSQAANYTKALTHLHHVLGQDADFHDGQWEAIDALVNRRERVLVVQRTGWGKSLVYFLAARLLRDEGRGLTILISPLLSLMRNQIASATRLGLRAETLNSTNSDDWSAIERDLRDNRIDVLLISPERLRNERFLDEVWEVIRPSIGMVAVDEAHCISDWGHDFRPDYRRIITLLDELPPQTPVLATTATANNRVVEDVAAILGQNIRVLRGALTRESLQLYVIQEALSQQERYILLEKLLRRIPGSGIIYCTTTYDCRQVAKWLQHRGLEAHAYYANVEEEVGTSRVELENKLLNNEIKALVASVALGMGFDKPDLHFVIHYQYPGSIIAYYQQIGRAGRGIDEARIILMHGGENDENIQRYFIDEAFPKQHHIEQVVDFLTHSPGLTRSEIQNRVNVKKSVLEKILLHLELEQIVTREDGYYNLTGTHRTPDYPRWAKVSQQRDRELRQMQAYIAHEGCLMRFLADALDDPTSARDCGQCQNCTGQRIKSNPQPDELATVQGFLSSGSFILFEPRKQFPRGVDKSLRGGPKPPHQAGLVLCYLNDDGWGAAVRAGRQPGGRFSDELVEAAAKLLTQYWQEVAKPPRWVTYVPSQHNPDALPDFTARLAARLKLPLMPLIKRVETRPPQKEMHNSFMQLQNVWGAFAIQGKVNASPVLLVDDMVDSRWTFTVLAELLHRAGCPAVHPFALAQVMG